MAVAAGAKDDAKRYQDFAEKVRNKYNQTYFNKDHYKGGFHTGNGGAIYFGIPSSENQAKVLQWLTKDIANRGYHLTTGTLAPGW